jgi:isopentenyl diphosphate isomerase/L-lactate dehydrogenase-like FMN-dependent dehydrogenase
MIHNEACLTDYEKNAEHLLSMPMFNQFNGLGVSEAHADFNRIKMKLRGLANLKKFKNSDPLRTRVLGFEVNSPIGLAAMPYQAMFHHDGELATAKAAAEMNHIYCLSSLSTFSIEQVVEATKGQGYMFIEIDPRLPAFVRQDLIKRAAKFGCFKGAVLNASY